MKFFMVLLEGCEIPQTSDPTRKSAGRLQVVKIW